MKNKNFKDSRLLEAFDYIDQKYIAEVADSLRFEKPAPAKGFSRRTWRHIIALAACMLLLGAIIPVLSYVIRNFTDFAAIFSDETSETTPLTEPETPPEETTAVPPETTEEETTAEETTTEETTAEDTTAEETTSPEPDRKESLGLEYKAFGDYAVLVGIGTCTDKDIVIASEYNGLPVTEIWHSAFVGVKGMTSVKIPEGVTYIESHAFENCTDLRAVYLPASLENVVGSLMTHGFFGCPAIETIEIAEGGKKYYSVDNCLIEKQTGTLVFGCGKSVIPTDGSVKSLGQYAFNGCRNLVNLALPEGMTDVRTGAFYGCEALRTLTLPKSLKTIRQNAFENCISLTSLTLPEGVTEIYNGAFRNCQKLKSVTLPGTLTLIDSEAFLGTAIESIVIPKGVKELGAVFSECEKLVSVTLPSGFEGFVGNTFAGCKSLKSLTLPKSLERIGMNTFYGCSALTDLRFEGTVKEWNAISKQERWNEGAAFTVIKCSDGDVELIEYDGSRGLEYKVIGGNAYLIGIGTCTDTDIVVASYYYVYPVKYIDQNAFNGQTHIKSIRLSGTVERISYGAFRGCTSLESIYISASLKEIESHVFWDCGNITKIEIDPENKVFEGKNCIIEKSRKALVLGCRTTVIPADGSVTRIDGLAFKDVIGLTSITIPEGVTLLSEDAFSGCPDLKSIHFSSTVESFELVSVMGCDALEVITVDPKNPRFYSSGNCVIEKETGALLLGCGKSVIPNDGSVKKIGYYAFGSNDMLTNITIPQGVILIESYAFAGCKNLKQVILPDSVTTVNFGVFMDCTSLERFEFSENTKTIGSYVFADCINLREVKMPAYGSIGDCVFMKCSSLKSITVPIGQEILYLGTFNECTSLETVVLPDTLTQIQSAFTVCTSLKSITIPAGVTFIEDFALCPNLSEFNFKGTVSEWHKVTKEKGWNEGCPFEIVHCSDGDVNLLGYDGSRGLEYKISDDGTYAILVGIGSCTDKDIVVATNYNGLPVKVIGERALYYEEADSIRVSDTIEIIEEEALGAGQYTSLYISASVRQLEGAFSTCDKLEKIEVDKNNPIYRSVNNCLINTKTKTLVLGCINSVIPADGSVTVIGNKAFEAARITNITIPDGIVEIGEEAFAWCMMLESITIPDSVKIIGGLAFADCERAKTLKLGKGVESIGNGAFYCCFLITDVKLPQNLKALGSNAFGNTRIKSLVIPDGVKFPEGAHNMFASCDYLESIVLPSGIESFGSWFFGGCENLKSITIPSSVKAIGDYAFYGCRSLKEIIIPEGVTEIGEGAFKQCTGITSIVVPESVKSIGFKAFAGCTELVSITLPSSITEIAASSFSECTKLRRINIPSGVASIGSHAFKDCTSLEKLILPDSVKTIGEYTFNGCSALKDIDLGEGLESIAMWAFENCTSLEQIVFPESMKEIAHDAFVRSGLESVRIPNGIKRINDGVFGACASLKDVFLPEGLTEIGYSAFSYCTSLETLVIPNTVTMIGGEIFKNCTSLKSLTIPSSVKTLQGSQHFMNCTSLTSMTIPEGIKMQFEYYNMFDGCTSLTSVTLPRDLPRVSRAIFRNCSALTEINYGGSIAQWNSLKKEDNWNSGCAATLINCSDGTVELYTSHSYDGSRGLQYKVNTDGKTVSFVGIGACTDSEIVIASSYDGKPVTEIIESALADNTKITAVIIPNSVLKIGQNAFARCAALKSIEIPDSVKAIGSGTFYQCTALESVKFGSGITELGNEMFYKCSALESVVLGENIKKIGAHSFCHCVKLNNVIVPDSVESIEMYAFENCSSLTEMTLGKGLKALGERSLAADNLTEVSFRGTKESWNSIAFDEKWNLYSGITVIHCTDGDANIGG